jgi:RNA polymerase sigma factor (sigma-70 family)
MADRQLHALVHHLRKAMAQQGAGGADDAELLERFVQQRDETAFEVLVWRHGTMVLSVCTRVLRDAQEAEDAFQATFLVLARKARSVGRASSLAGWLYRVAFRVALRARSRSGRGGTRMPLPDDVPAPQTTDNAVWRDLGPVLDEEVNRLPEKYRLPFVLCYLEGHTNEEAARQLGCPRGTILSRLSRGREWLRTRLTRRGLTLAAGGLATALAADAGAAVPPPLVASTVSAATAFVAGKAVGVVSTHVLALTEGVLQAMNLTRIKWIGTAALAVLLTTTGAALFAQREGAAQREGRPAAPAAAADGRRGDAGRESPHVRGVVRAVDAAQNTITVAVDATRDGAANPDKTYTVAKDAEVLMDEGRGRFAPGREVKLADLAAGSVVTLLLAKDKQTVEAILAEGPTLSGKLSAVDATKGTVTLAGAAAGRGRGGEEIAGTPDKTYTVGKTAEIVIDDGRGRRTSLHEGKLTDLSIGCHVTVKLAPDLKEAVLVQAEGSRVQGTVKAIDAGKLSITIGGDRGRGGEAAAENTYIVAQNADILVEDLRPRRFFPVRSAKLEDVPVGSIVSLMLSPNMTTAVMIRAEGPSVTGALKSVDPNKGTVSITIGGGRGTDGEEKSYTVAKDVRVVIDGNESKLSDLKVGDNPTPITLKLTLSQQAVQVISVNVAPRGR